MSKILDNCLFEKDSHRYDKIKELAKTFSKSYIGNNIPCDHIFSIIDTYCKRNGFDVQIFRFPIEDEKIWALTSIKKGCIFVTINTSLELNKQIFAAAHELYHIYCYIDGDDDELVNGSILIAENASDIDVSMEEREANAFAALILAPLKQVEQQKKIADVDAESIAKLIILVIYFMDCFALPYKAMVIKLWECKIIQKEQADSLLLEEKNVENFIRTREGMGSRWLKRTYDNNLNAIRDIIESNKQNLYISDERAATDLEVINHIISSLPKCKE